MPDMALGAHVKRRREELQLTQEQLSQRSGVNQQSISALESRDSKQSRYLLPLARALGLQADELLSGRWRNVQSTFTSSRNGTTLHRTGESGGKREATATSEDQDVFYVEALKQIAQDWLTLDIEDRERWAQELKDAADARRARRLTLAPVKDLKKKQER